MKPLLKKFLHMVLSSSILLCFCSVSLVLVTKPAVAETLPLTGATAYGPDGEIKTYGLAWGNYWDTIEPELGKINHKSCSIAAYLGLGSVWVFDGISSDYFTVARSGPYKLHISGFVNGHIREGSSASLTGVSKSGGELRVGASCANSGDVWKYLHKTDFGAAAVITEMSWATWSVFLNRHEPTGIGSEVLNAIKSAISPQVEWNGNSFNIYCYANLQAGIQYKWNFFVGSSIASGGIGNIKEVALYEANIYGLSANLTYLGEVIPPPTGVTASDGDYPDKIRVIWNTVSNADEYNIYRSTINNSETATKIATNVGRMNNLYDDESVVTEVDYYYWIQSIQYSPSNISDFSSPDSGNAIPAQGNDFLIYDVPWDDDNSESDHDGVVEGWERADLEIALKSKANVTSVEATLSSSISGVVFQDNENWYGTINDGDVSYGDGDYNIDFVFDSYNNCHFMLHITYRKSGIEYYQDLSFDKDIYQPGNYSGFSVPDYTFDDSPSIKPQNNGDGVFQSGEKVHIKPLLCNDGLGEATRIDVTLLCDQEGVEVDPGDRRYLDLSPGACGYLRNDRYFRIRANNHFTGVVSVDVQIIWDEGGEDPCVIPRAIELEVESAPWIDVRPDDWNFGVSGTEENVLKTVTVHNVGTQNMQVTGIVPSISHVSWIGDPLPWTIPVDGYKEFQIVIDTANLQGSIDFEVVVESDGRLVDLTPLSDRIAITGLVSDAYSVYQIPGVTHGDNPDVSGNIIVWGDNRNGNWDIYAYDLASETETAICTNPGPQDYPKISGNIIAWEDWRNDDGSWSNGDIYGFDLDAGQELVISDHSSDEDLVGVDGNLVAFVRDYYEFTEPTNWDTARNLYVYDYQGSGVFIERYATNFTSSPGHNPKQSVDDEGDFGDGLLVFERHEITWYSEYGYWGSENQHLEKIDFAFGETGPSSIPIGWRWLYSATTHRFVYADEDDENDEQVWLWENGSVRQVTTEERDHADDNLAIGENIIVYDKQSLPGLYYWDLSNNDEFWLTDQTNNDPMGCRMDGNLVVWAREDSSSGERGIYYVFADQADISVVAPDIEFSNNQPHVGEIIDVNVVVRNLSPKDATENITVRLYNGDPDSGGTQLGSEEVVSGGIAGQGSASVTFDNISIDSTGEHAIYVRISVPGTDNAANNKASKTLNIVIEQHTLTVSSTAGGSVTTPGEGDFPYDHNDLATIEANENANYNFVNWSGTAVDAGKVADPNAASTTVTMDADYAVHANFTVDRHTLTVSSTAGGSVTMPGEGDFSYYYNHVATIEANANANYYFVNWSGTAVDAGKVADPNAASTRVTVDGDYTVHANFDGDMNVALVIDDPCWMYQNLPGATGCGLTANVSITDDPLSNNSYSYEWEFILPDDVSLAPTTIDSGGSGDECWTFAAPGCDQPQGLSDSGQAFKVKVTVTGDDHGNVGIAEAEFGIALLGDVNNDCVINVIDRAIITRFWRGFPVGQCCLRDCDLSCDGRVNIIDRSIVTAVWKGTLGKNSVSNECPCRSPCP